MNMLDITHRRALNSDSEAIQNILETTSKFMEAVALYRKFGFINNTGAKLAQGHDIGLVRDL
jgi:hypothetical protein